MLPRAGLLALLIVLGVAVVEVFFPPATPDVYGGLPQARPWADRLSTHVIRNEGFSLAYSEWRRTALWVGWRLHRLAPGEAPPRPEHFVRDRRTLWPVSSDDYTGSGYDRGHLAPNYIIARLFGREAQLDTFRMSNIAPQTPRLNQLLWQRIEAMEADVMTERFPETYVLTGPVYASGGQRLASGVSVPVAYYRIWLRPQRDGTPQALALRVPQTVCGDEALTEFVVDIDRLEAETGIDFFAALDDAQEAAFESTVPADFWGLGHHARQPARYLKSFRGPSCVRGA